MSPLLCRLHAALPEGARWAPPARGHARSCLRCQVAETRERVLRREMARLGSVSIPAPPYLAASVMARLGEQDSADAGHRILPGSVARRAVATGAGVTAAAIVAGLVRRRSRTA